VRLFFCNQQAIPLSFWWQSAASMNLERAEDEPGADLRKIAPAREVIASVK
jgi:hypothetical protein